MELVCTFFVLHRILFFNHSLSVCTLLGFFALLSINASTSSARKPTCSTTTVIFSSPVDDPSEDACSVCLEPFKSQDPATITSCKHDYHLHCILEWAKRSNECPICSQLLVMKDPASQELLVSLKNERCPRSRNPNTTSTILNLREEDLAQNASYSDDSDFHKRIMRHLVAAANRARYLRRREGQRASGQALMSSPEKILVFDSSDRYSQPDHCRSPSSVAPINANTAFNAYTGSEPTMKPRVRHWQAPSDNTRRPNACDIFSFPESLKSKFSARYKESLQAIKEKLVTRNSSLKELSKGVQREINAGIAGVARMIERLDLVARGNTASSTGQVCAASTANSFEGIHVQENVIIEAPALENGNEVYGSSSNATSSDS